MSKLLEQPAAVINLLNHVSYELLIAQTFWRERERVCNQLFLGNKHGKPMDNTRHVLWDGTQDTHILTHLFGFVQRCFMVGVSLLQCHARNQSGLTNCEWSC